MQNLELDAVWLFLPFSSLSCVPSTTQHKRTDSIFSQVTDAEGGTEGYRVKRSKQKGMDGEGEMSTDSTCASYACMRDATR